MNGLARSSRPDIYERVLKQQMDQGNNLNGLIRHFRYGDARNPLAVAELLKKAIAADDLMAVAECLLFAVHHFGTDKIASGDLFVSDALAYFNAHKESRWIHDAWYLPTFESFVEKLPSDGIDLLLQNLAFVNRIDHHAERVLALIAKRAPADVWDYFGERLRRESSEGDSTEGKFEATPFKFHELNKILSADPKLGLTKGLSWFQDDPKLFRFRGGRAIRNAFADCPPEFVSALSELVKNGGEVEADFALEILPNYNGEASMHAVLMETIDKFPNDEGRMNRVSICIDSTGVVSGELGLVQALQSRKELMEKWLKDERPTVKAFAAKHIAELDLQIASEYRSAESRTEMWKRDFEDEDSDEPPS